MCKSDVPLTDDLKALLTACSLNPTDATPFLVAADYCSDHDLHKLEWLLRYLAQHKRHVLFTGSRRYGTPKPDSDFDWVIRLTSGDERWVTRHADEVCSQKVPPAAEPNIDTYFTQPRLGSEYAGCDRLEVALRFGPVNLIVVNNRDQWACWEDGTAELAAEGPVTRDRAVEVFTRLWAETQQRWEAEAARMQVELDEYMAGRGLRRRYRLSGSYARFVGER